MKNTTLFLLHDIAVYSCKTPADPIPIFVFKKSHVKDPHTYTYDYKFGSVDSSSRKASSIKIFNSEGESIVEEYLSIKYDEDQSVEIEQDSFQIFIQLLQQLTTNLTIIGSGFMK